MGELRELCNPLVEFIKENYNPYTEIVVTMDSITVRQKVERRMNEQVTSKVDECIISVCNKVQNNESAPGEYADTVEALAALVEARAKLGQLFNGFA